ncbi:MAG TPA: ABC transporter substrate-binding protein [Gaiellaceae bacterium]
MRRLSISAALLCGALALSLPGALAGGSSTPGVTSTSILLGGTAPITGPESAYAPVARGAQAYFAYVNAHGGVNKRKITYKVLDDAYDPSKTIQATRQLVQQDKVFAIFNSIGTEHVIAVRPYLNQLGVPQLFVGSGATVIADQRSRYRWTMGYLPSFAGEGAVYGRYIAKHLRGTKIGVLSENSEYGNELLRGLKAGLADKARIVSSQTYEVTDVDVQAQVARLRASGASTFMIFALPKQALQSFIYADKLGWRPHVFITSVSIDPFVMTVARLNTGGRTTNGAISLAFLKDPTDPRLAKDKGVRLYNSVLKKFGNGANAKAVANFYGMATAFTMVDALRHAGKNPTRASLLKAATHLNERDNPFLRKGIFVRTTPKDYYPIDQVQLQRYRKTQWAPIGGLISTRGG